MSKKNKKSKSSSKKNNKTPKQSKIEKSQIKIETPLQASSLGVTQGDAIGLFLAFALLVSGLFASLSQLTPLLSVAVLAVAVFAQLRLTQPVSSNLTPVGIWERLKKNLTTVYMVLCVGLMLPTLYALMRKWGAEFPFEGDYDHHVYATMAALAFWKKAVFALLGSLVAGALLKSNGFKYWSLVPLVVAVGAGYVLDPPQYYFARYPAGAYMFNSFYMWMSESMNWSAPINATRLGIFTAIPTWLLVLRPLFVNRSLTPGFLGFAALVLLQRDAHMYFSSPYLEAWSLVFVFTALERVIFNPNGYFVAMLLIGFSTIFKENTVFVLPCVWAVWVWQKDKQSHLTKWTTAVASGLPFVIYYVYRKVNKIFREVEFSSFSEAFSSERVGQGMERLFVQYTWFGLAALLLVIVICVYWFGQQKLSRRLLLAIFAAAVFQFFFFYMDKITLNLPMYTRFYFLFFGLIACFAWGVDRLFGSAKSNLVAGAIVVLMLPSCLAGLTLHSKEVFYLNSLDVPRSPEHYPIRTLIEKAESQNLLRPGAIVLINSPKQRFLTRSMAFGYKDLIANYKFRNDPKTFLSPECNCRQVGANIMVPLFYHTGTLPVPPVSPQRLQIEKQCIQSIEQSCSKVVKHTLPTGEMIGALGIL